MKKDFKKMVQAIDGFALFMPTADVKEDLIVPVLKGEATFDERADYIAEYIWYAMNYEDNPTWLKEHGITGKPQYYKQGNWNGTNLLLDILGEDAGIKDAIRSRLQNFEALLYEYYLLNTLKDLNAFKEVTMADKEADIKGKVDLIAKDQNLDIYNISVYSSTDEKALSKLNRDSRSRQYNNRLAYNVKKSGDPRDPSNVTKWLDEIVYNDKHLIYIDPISNKWIIS